MLKTIATLCLLTFSSVAIARTLHNDVEIAAVSPKPPSPKPPSPKPPSPKPKPPSPKPPSPKPPSPTPPSPPPPSPPPPSPPPPSPRPRYALKFRIPRGVYGRYSIFPGSRFADVISRAGVTYAPDGKIKVPYGTTTIEVYIKGVVADTGNGPQLILKKFSSDGVAQGDLDIGTYSTTQPDGYRIFTIEDNIDSVALMTGQFIDTYGNDKMFISIYSVTLGF